MTRRPISFSPNELSGARLGGANLSEAQANERTTWPESFDPAAAGVQISAI